MKQHINSPLNNAIAFFANTGVVGKKRTIKFQPRKSENGKTFITKPCTKCNYKFAIGFIGFEEPINMVWCPICKKLSWPEETTPRGESCAPYEEAGPDTETKLCRATTKKGQPCRNKAMAGSDYCGPHQRGDY